MPFKADDARTNKLCPTKFAKKISKKFWNKSEQVENEMIRACETCSYFEHSYGKETEDGYCRRHAPQPVNTEFSIAAGIALLTWWYVRDHSDEETANKELDAFSLKTDADPELSYWPLVSVDDWCGDYEKRAPARRAPGRRKA